MTALIDTDQVRGFDEQHQIISGVVRNKLKVLNTKYTNDILNKKLQATAVQSKIKINIIEVLDEVITLVNNNFIDFSKKYAKNKYEFKNFSLYTTYQKDFDTTKEAVAWALSGLDSITDIQVKAIINIIIDFYITDLQKHGYYARKALFSNKIIVENRKLTKKEE